MLERVCKHILKRVHGAHTSSTRGWLAELCGLAVCIDIDGQGAVAYSVTGSVFSAGTGLNASLSEGCLPTFLTAAGSRT